MSDKKISFEDLLFENAEGGKMTNCKPSTIHLIDSEGHPISFTSYGHYGNVRDINFTISSSAGGAPEVYWKYGYWQALHPLLSPHKEA